MPADGPETERLQEFLRDFRRVDLREPEGPQAESSEQLRQTGGDRSASRPRPFVAPARLSRHTLCGASALDAGAAGGLSCQWRPPPSLVISAGPTAVRAAICPVAGGESEANPGAKVR